MISENSVTLDQRSLDLRKSAISAIEGGGRGHPGATLSLIEIMRVLYDDVLKFDAEQPDWPQRDRCILSKGHGCLALYTLLADKGFFEKSQLQQFCKTGALLGGHPESKVPGVEASTGALGHGLAIGVGMALATKIKQLNSHIFVVMGDGEINEGAVWESALSAGHHQLDNLVAIIDYNKLQSYGTTKEILDLEPLIPKWQSFGFETCEVDGHNVDALKQCFASLDFNCKKPKAIICHTIKGKGLSFAENNPAWHHKSGMKTEQIQAMYEELS